MPVNGLSIGRDLQIVILHPFAPNGRLDISVLDGFEPKQINGKINVIPVNKPPIRGVLPQGWDFTIMVQRTDPQISIFIAALEAAYFSGVSVPVGTVYEYITEPGGGTSTYCYNGVAFSLSQAGAFNNDKEVKIALECHASTRTVA
jgi:hypothetical protein